VTSTSDCLWGNQEAQVQAPNHLALRVLAFCHLNRTEDYMMESEHEMERDERRSEARPTSSNHALAAFVLGTAAGAAIALLCAPSSGASTRAYLSRRARAGRRRAQAALRSSFHALNAGHEQLSSAMKEGQAHWQQIKEHAAGALEEGRGAAVRVVEHGRRVVDEAKDGLERLTTAAAGGTKRHR
jgi:gas vesicle protein